MKTIGLLGGMSWESSLEYYRILNEEVKKQMGGSHSAKCVMFSFDFQKIEDLQHKGEWNKLTEEMVEQSMNLKKAGADFIVICTNTMHIMASEIEKKTGLKVLHIAEATGKEIKKQGLNKVALFGTKYTMEGSFYKEILEKNFGVEIIIPDELDREVIHQVIYKELICGIHRKESKEQYIDIIKKMESKGAEGVILGCTEIPQLIKQSDVSIPVFDTTRIHAMSAVEFAL